MLVFTEIKKKHSEIISIEKKNRKRESYILPKPFPMAGKQERHANASGKLLPFLSLADVQSARLNLSFLWLLSISRKKIDKFDSLPPYNLEKITCQDMVGQGPRDRWSCFCGFPF